jgi:hypothetical protein
VDGPENLLQAVDFHDLAHAPARMISREAGVVRRMPVLSRQNELEPALRAIGDGHDLIAVPNRERASRHEIVLKVDENEGVHASPPEINRF